MSADFEHPHIVIDCPTNAEGKIDIDVKAEGVDSGDHLITVLLLVVEKLTGVSTDSYVLLVDEVHKIAARQRDGAR